MNRALERCFSQIPQNVISQARDLQRSAVEGHAATLSASAKMLSSVLEKQEITDQALARIAKAGSLSHIEVLAADRSTVASAEGSIPAEQRGELDELLSSVRSGRSDEPSFSDRRGFDAAFADMS